MDVQQLSYLLILISLKGKHLKWKISLPELVVKWTLKMLSYKLIINKQYNYVYLNLNI